MTPVGTNTSVTGHADTEFKCRVSRNMYFGKTLPRTPWPMRPRRGRQRTYITSRRPLSYPHHFPQACDTPLPHGIEVTLPQNHPCLERLGAGRLVGGAGALGLQRRKRTLGTHTHIARRVITGGRRKPGVTLYTRKRPCSLLNPVSGLTTPCSPRIQPVDQSGTKGDDAMSIDQSGTVHNYFQNWREKSKRCGQSNLCQSHEGLEGLIRLGDWV